MQDKLNIVADENIPFLDELLADVAAVRRLPGRAISAADLQDVDALLVRSVTRVDAALLSGHCPRFIGSCTIGVDHVDQELLQQKGIRFAHAPGCNAAAVVDYVVAALLAIDSDIAAWRNKSVGIVGLGEVGSRLARRLENIGLVVRAFDPFKASARHTLAEVLGCDVVSLHVPLTRSGAQRTFHLLGRHELESLADNAVLINSSRGPVIDNQALLQVLQQKPLHVVLDVYETEPAPPVALLDAVDIATAHIAGYSLHGKMRGTLRVVEALMQCFSLPLTCVATGLSDKVRVLCVSDDQTAGDIVRAAYDIRKDASEFARLYRQAGDEKQQAQAFDNYRKHYPNRYEFAYQEISGQRPDMALLEAAGFDAALRE